MLKRINAELAARKGVKLGAKGGSFFIKIFALGSSNDVDSDCAIRNDLR